MVDYDQAKAALKEAIENVLGEKVEKFDRSSRLFDDLKMDSTTMLETLIELEDKFGLDVNPEELDIEDFLTVDSYVNFIVTEKNNRGEK
ncbi:acyl carrier protein [Pantoea sp. S61]|uniref:acyl carrier protein n=1 Tax=Pantoea sp. S61 TaxID=2767442 RepID=UPI0019094953|nr:phosphopantetheine-binding protein [Pantoea sp. S61]MBK0126163.1 acyl carrier protein [Pantoea sp. S61]